MESLQETEQLHLGKTKEDNYASDWTSVFHYDYSITLF
jgi:hypothetical protein